MFATLISIIFSLLIVLKWGFFFDPLPTDVIAYTEGFYGLGFLMALVLAISWGKMRISTLAALLFAYPFFTFAIAVFTATRLVPNGLFLVPIWFIVSGLATDGFLWLMKANSPESLNDIKESIKKAKSIADYQEGIDQLTEWTAKSIQSCAIDKTHQALNVFSNVYQGLRAGEGKEVQVIYPLEMLEMLSQMAIDKGLTATAQRIFSTLGTLGLESFKIDPELAPFAIHKIENGTLLALRKKLSDLSIKGCITIQQTALYSPQYSGWGPFVAQAVKSLNAISKEIFRMDKEQPLNYLIAPFVELDTALKQYEPSPDYTIAKNEINRAIEEFQALNAVLKAMPRI